ncbi:hypothetical protein CAEBREN_24130 [Caenorhabditis brenneri]|uniref:Uncharacterized protein n=1 Tax=Caenorhabditis brenneri TaxID=135651 RepID=G0MZ96_CAEBE|nr:hypothetical protein CAEBREN_24130 [Caenorhabditis brenneri]
MSGGNWSNWPPQPPQQSQHPQHPQHQQHPQQAQRAQNDMYQNQQDMMQQGYRHPQQQPQQQPFMFNANANVFVPRNQPMPPPQQDYGYYTGVSYQQQSQQGYHYQQNQFNVTSAPSSSFNAMYQEDTGFDAFAQFGQQSQQYHPSNELAEQIRSSKCSGFLNEILVGCEQLLAEGLEESSTWIAAIRHRFEDPNMDDESKKIAVRLIIEMAFTMDSVQVGAADPQHIFSNLLRTLSMELKDFLRVYIIPILGEFHENRRQQENDARVFMAVFYAEAFVKLTLDNGSRFERIGEALCDQIDEILKFPAKDDYMKCLLRAFKVSGAELDTSENLRKRFDQILTIMGGFAKGSPVLSETMKGQIFSLIECRTRGWDRAATRGGTDTNAGYLANRDSDSFDDSTDNDLTEEERQFLESHLDQVASTKYAYDDFDDQEVMNEFGKFVKEELQQAEDQKTAEMFQNCSVKDDGNDDEGKEKTPTEENKQFIN